MERLFGNIYQVVENPNEESAGIEIIDGEYKGLVYQYGKVEFADVKPHLNFQRTIRRMPEGLVYEKDFEELNNNENLNKLMGDILVELIEEQVKRDEQRNIEGTDQTA